ncbi:MAG: cobalt ECF transporter T component CbiQ [Brachymonas sp.]|nr:cobalt ECF transporter T component CbiQ [Brachymonas sp.]
MNGHFIQHQGGSSVLARWDARLRLVALLLLAFAFSAVTQLRTVPVMLAVTALFWGLSGLPFAYLLRRLRYPSLLVLCMAVGWLLAGGKTVWYQFGPITISREGVHAALLLMARFYCILTLAIAFLAVSPLLTIIDAMRALGIPFIMVDMALLMVRYLEVLKEDIHNMNVSMRLRGFRNKAWSLQTIKTKSWLAGSLLLRSYDRAEGIYKAMRLRGYGRQVKREKPAPSTIDWGGLVGSMAVVVAVFWLG